VATPSGIGSTNGAFQEVLIAAAYQRCWIDSRERRRRARIDPKRIDLTMNAPPKPPRREPARSPSPEPFSMPAPSVQPEKRPSLAARAASSRPAWLVVGIALVELIRAVAEAWPKH
jgi:hypothetical protein